MRTFEARHKGICAYCDETIYPGDEVRYNDDDELEGVRCHISSRSPFTKPKTTPPNICPVCSMDHAGECL